jgi:[2Fe-2S] binding domain/Molybdopterin-binding domain of aldehyde dehydrogenase
MSAAALLSLNPTPTDRDIDLAMTGNICRCAAYVRIRAAIHGAAKTLEGWAVTIHDRTLSRRSILKAGVGLAIGVYIAPGGKALAQTPPVAPNVNMAPNTFLTIAPDNTVTVLSKHIEFGQGPFTGMATLVAEELDADWSQMRADHAPSNPVLYKNLLFGVQGTGGSGCDPKWCAHAADFRDRAGRFWFAGEAVLPNVAQ